MKKTILLSSMAIIILSSSVMANKQVTLQSASSHYQKGDYKKSLSEYTHLAEKNNVDAQIALALLYSHGKLIVEGIDSTIDKKLPYSEKLALKWLRKSAENGYTMAQYELGRLYSKGLFNLKKDEIVALIWYKKAKRKGHPSALYNIGNMYRQGRGGLKIDYKNAIEHYKLANESMKKFRNKHHANALYNIGFLYSQGGYGIRRDVSEALKYFSKAALFGQEKGLIGIMAICQQNPYIKECK